MTNAFQNIYNPQKDYRYYSIHLSKKHKQLIWLLQASVCPFVCQNYFFTMLKTASSKTLYQITPRMINIKLLIIRHS